MLKPEAKLALKITESVGIAFGPAVIVLNLFSFKISHGSYYYLSKSEWGIAAGVFLVCIALVARKWQR
jgi:protein-S-isoprenylcysteine O-methyltransferase Ste14